MFLKALALLAFVSIACLVPLGQAKNEVEKQNQLKRMVDLLHGIQALSERDIPEEAYLREIRGFRDVLKGAAKEFVKTVAGQIVNGKRSTEEEKEMKRVENVLRDLESMDLSQHASQRQIRGFMNLIKGAVKALIKTVVSHVANQ
ncbi:maximins 4/H3 type 4-like [Ascaphus truei]|uniref:maximins 4/H3 type 4-like n=1 Tax=Ascaphus truei TaxID=8439 RepID=UPI003F5A79EB